MAKTSASFTLMDYTDGVSLITGIDSNLPFVCTYNFNYFLSIRYFVNISIKIFRKNKKGYLEGVFS